MAYNANSFSPQNTKTNIISVNGLILYIEPPCQLVLDCFVLSTDIKLNVSILLYLLYNLLNTFFNILKTGHTLTGPIRYELV